MLYQEYKGNSAVISPDKDKRLKFKLFFDTGIMIITDNTTLSSSLYDSKNKKMIGTIYDYSRKDSSKHFKCFTYEFLSSVPPYYGAWKRRFIQAMFILNGQCYLLDRFHMYDFLIITVNQVIQEAKTDIDHAVIMDCFNLAMIINKQVDEYKQITGHYSCDDYDIIDMETIAE